jgi:hypothetical protein
MRNGVEQINIDGLLAIKDDAAVANERQHEALSKAAEQSRLSAFGSFRLGLRKVIRSRLFSTTIYSVCVFAVMFRLCRIVSC